MLILHELFYKKGGIDFMPPFFIFNSGIDPNIELSA